MVNQHQEAGQLHKTKVILDVIVPPNGDAAMTQQPCEEALDFPASAVAAKGSPILRFSFLAVAAVRSDQFNAVALGEPSVQRIAIVGAIREKASRRSARMSGLKRRFSQRRFVWGSARHVDGERKTASICNCHDLASLAALGLADGSAPFFAGTKVASIAHSEGSSSPRWMRSSARALSMRAHSPERFHAWKRRWHVAGEGYRSGRSRQRAPVFITQRMPSMTRRSSRRGRPRREVGFGSSGSSTAHCASVSFIDDSGETNKTERRSNSDF